MNDDAIATTVEGDRSARTRSPGRRLRGAVANRLGTAILSGEYQPGDILPGEIAAAEALQVSRSAYREAMQALAAKGLVESRPKTGTRVLPRERWNLLDPEVLGWAFNGEPDARLVRSLFELRLVIEPAAAALAAGRRDKADIKRMRDALNGMRRHSLATPEGRAADRDFHDALLRATNNDAFVVISASIGAAVAWTTLFKQRTRALPRDPIPDHARVFDAISAGDVDGASAAMRMLVELAVDDTQDAMTRLAPEPDAAATKA
ncbi:DNA-binding FadR family transcriptional regulator [Sphingomonas jejuensis]|uniref:DNA-binding FadR family transcriptional regulator n=1 Tax=Sphingomonas jejuensis TaxID=904715 RepID=A0ABX0XL85_9SPHN|nr:FadR/GntR family transcriptional regulator [Sphingomonas jejuensis]NJC34128.1 DNA-binding FadR family transcriptional regulator [Sphingomonas jejuensis]